MNFKFLKATFASLVILTSTANAGVIDFTALDDANNFNSVLTQDGGSLSVTDGILTLNANSWFSVDLIDVVGVDSLDFANTIMSFDFMSTGTPDISGIATSNLNTPRSKKSFNLDGTQDWGLDSFAYTDFNEWVHFEINLGDYIDGDFSTLMFINDCDKCSGEDILVSFKDMTLTPSQIPEPNTLALFALATFGLVSRRVKKQSK